MSSIQAATTQRKEVSLSVPSLPKLSEVDTEIASWKKAQGIPSGKSLTPDHQKKLVGHLWDSWCQKNQINNPGAATLEQQKAFSQYLGFSLDGNLKEISKLISLVVNGLAGAIDPSSKRSQEELSILVSQMSNLKKSGFSSEAIDGTKKKFGEAIVALNKTIAGIPSSDPQRAQKIEVAYSDFRLQVASAKLAILQPNTLEYRVQESAIKFEQDFQVGLDVELNQISDLKMYTTGGLNDLLKKNNETVDAYKARIEKSLGLKKGVLPERLDGQTDEQYVKILEKAVLNASPSYTAKFLSNLNSEAVVVSAQLAKARARGDQGAIIYYESRLTIINDSIKRLSAVSSSSSLEGISGISQSITSLMENNLVGLRYLRDSALARKDQGAADTIDKQIASLSQTISQVRAFFKDFMDRATRALEASSRSNN